jgi:signal transduction histidine kinase/CheY-like chemotaxis protein
MNQDPTDSPDIAARVLAEQLHLTGKQAARFPLPVLVVDVFVTWLFWREGLGTVAFAWLAIRVVLQAVTTFAMRAQSSRIAGRSLSMAELLKEQRLVVLLFGAMGVSRALIVPALFMHTPTETHYIFTMVCMGLAAAGVGNVGGQLRVYLAFAVPLGLSLSVSWFLQDSTAATIVGLLLPAVFAFLSMFVREQARSLGRIFQLVEDGERLTASVQREHDRAQAALAAKTHFLASASHDLRQPVTSIGLLVGLVAEGLHDDRQKALLGRVTESVSALEDLLRGLLDLSRLDSGTVVPSHAPVALRNVFASVQLHARPVADAKGLALRFRGDALGVRSDAVLLQQMLLNLLDNALRHTDQGGVLVSARRRANGRVLLEVWDTGCGIASEDQQSVFEEFVQIGNGERDRRKGLGLGLAIVKRSATLLGHALRLDSRVGVGSRFSIELPFERIAVPALSRAQTALSISDSKADSTTQHRSLAGTTLWLLEDEPTVREALTARLEAWGATVESFSRLAELEGALARGLTAPHALLTDHRLPDGTGLQAIDKVRARHGHVPALVLTGDTGPHELTQFEQRGARVLHKPFRHSELRTLLSAWAPEPIV